MQIANRQREVITLEQLRRVGLSSDAITRRLHSGWLVRLHQGVYAVGMIGAIGRVQAGLLACGREAIACEHSSAALHHLLPYPPP